MYAFIVNKLQNRTINEAGELEYVDRFLLIKLIACRSKQPDIISFKHRFKDDNDMAVVEDINSPRPLSTTSEEARIKDKVNGTPQKTTGARRIVGQ